MENGGIKNIVLIALVVVFSFFIGSMSADGLKNAVTPIVFVAGLFVLLYLGKNIKFAMFYLPPILLALPLGSVGPGFFAAAVCPFALVYWFVMRMMGYVRFTWTRHLGLDLLVLLLFLYICACYYRHPVSIEVLGLELDTIGGKDYVYFVLGMLGYVAVSCIPFTAQQLYLIPRRLVWLGIFLSVWGIVSSRFSGNHASADDVSFGDEISNTRFTLFSGLGMKIFYLLFASFPIRKLFFSPGKLLLLLICTAAVVISGWRGTLICFALTVFALSFFKRELITVITLGVFTYGGLLFLSQEHAFNGLPYGMQRALCAVPGIHVSKEIEDNAEGSSEWRKDMWKWALDPRTHLIEDYVWGDGPGHSRSDMLRRNTAIMRGTVQGGDNRDFARLGVWHSGCITLLNSYGIVGLSLFVLYQISLCAVSVAACFKYRRTPYYPYFMVHLASIIPGQIMFHLSAGTTPALYSALPTMAFTKLLYVKAEELGLNDTFFRREPYVPLMIQDINQEDDSKKAYELT